ncbi:dihydrofolate reductase [Gottschalkia purinilytica]|nr:dihydrofolate reductase [Gottschalkia purinilytica]
MIVAVDRSWGIGRNNDMLAHIEPDLEYFRNVTEGHTVIMGYNTYLSLPEENRPLPNRKNIVITRKNIKLEGVTIIDSIEETLDLINKEYKNEEVFIAGGESIYNQMLPYADKLYITHIFRKFDDPQAFFPIIDDSWRIEDIKMSEENIKHECPHIFATYVKKEK